MLIGFRPARAGLQGIGTLVTAKGKTLCFAQGFQIKSFQDFNARKLLDAF